MLDENLPTFQFKQQSDTPLSIPIYFTRNGSEPAPEFVLERAHPSTNPAAGGKYAVALRDPYAKQVIYAEVVVSPEWTQPTLSAAEIRAQQAQAPSNGARLQPAPVIPDTFTIQLYDPDHTVVVRYSSGSLTKTDSWEFDMLSQSFKMPTPSQLDRQNGQPQSDFRPRNMFKWKRDSKLSKNMTCYNVGKSLGKHKSKDPDITVALFQMGRDSAVTVYEPNLQRVDMEDRKGLDIVLVIGAAVIRDLYLAPEKKSDLFNTGTGVPVAMAAGKRKNSRPSPPPNGLTPPGAFGRAPTADPSMAMSGALASSTSPTMATANVASSSRPNDSGIDPETLRLMKQMKKEDDEQLKRQARERKRREEEETRRVEQMLRYEESEKRRRQAEVDRETERLRQLYGVQGQEASTNRPPGQRHNSNPPMPPQQYTQGYRPPPSQQQPVQTFPPPPQPQRPLSTGPGPGSMGPFNTSTITSLFRPSASQQSGQQQRPGAHRPYGGNTQAPVSSFFQNNRLTKKRSMQW